MDTGAMPGVHRHTVRNRLERVERLTGRSLTVAAVRHELWLALRLREVAVAGATGGERDKDRKDKFTAYKLLIADVVDGKLVAMPRGVMAAAAVMQGSQGGVDLPKEDIDRVKSHLAKYYAKMDEKAPWE